MEEKNILVDITATTAADFHEYQTNPTEAQTIFSVDDDSTMSIPSTVDSTSSDDSSTSTSTELTPTLIRNNDEDVEEEEDEEEEKSATIYEDKSTSNQNVITTSSPVYSSDISSGSASQSTSSSNVSTETSSTSPVEVSSSKADAPLDETVKAVEDHVSLVESGDRGQDGAEMSEYLINSVKEEDQDPHGLHRWIEDPNIWILAGSAAVVLVALAALTAICYRVRRHHSGGYYAFARTASARSTAPLATADMSRPSLEAQVCFSILLIMA
jgi:cobalamin biosynthesis Mg chelatase CobN